WIRGVKPEPTTGNKPLQHFIVDGLAKPGGSATGSATFEFVAGYVRQRVRQLDLTPPVSYAMPAHRMPSCSLERVAQTRTVHAGEPLRELAERLRTPLYEPGGAFAAWSAAEHSA